MPSRHAIMARGGSGGPPGPGGGAALGVIPRPGAETRRQLMADPTDRRAAERFPVSGDTACSFVSPVVEDFGPGKIQNISMDGIGLMVARRVEPGGLLAVGLSNPARGFTKTVLVRVVHATPLHGGSLVGRTFTAPLAYQESTSLVMYLRRDRPGRHNDNLLEVPVRSADRTLRACAEPGSRVGCGQFSDAPQPPAAREVCSRTAGGHALRGRFVCSRRRA